MVFFSVTYYLIFVSLTFSVFSDVNGKIIFLSAPNMQWIKKYYLIFLSLTCSGLSDVNGKRIFLSATNMQWIIKAVWRNIVYHFQMLHSYYEKL